MISFHRGFYALVLGSTVSVCCWLGADNFVRLCRRRMVSAFLWFRLNQIDGSQGLWTLRKTLRHDRNVAYAYAMP